MKIKKLELKNGYKRFHHLTIDLGEAPKRFVALVGPNGCGKSSVFDGMLFIHNAHGALGQHAPHLAKGSYHSQSGSERYDYTNIVLEMDTGLYQDVRNLRNQSETGSTMFSFRSPYRFNNQLDVQSTKAMPDIKLNGYGAQYSSAMDSKMDDNYRRLNIKFHRLRKKNDWRETETKAHVIGELNSSIKNCLDLEIDDIGDVEAGQGSLFFKKSGQQASFNFNVLSSGEKEVIDILLDLYLREDDYNETIFLIDEPELHINTSIQRKLLVEIDRLIGENCQIWISTHSIGFLRALQNDLKDDCQVIHFDPSIPYASQPHTLRPIEKSAANWKSIFQTALDDLTNLVAPKRIVYCEGKANPVGGKEAGLDAQVFNQIFAEAYPDTLFVSSGGNTELDQRSAIAIAILGKALSELEVLVLKDRDMASGKDVSQSARKEYLRTNDDNHRVLKRWELENYLYDKEVLEKYCQTNGRTLDDAEFDKQCTDIENDNLKDKTGVIRRICGITTSISPDKFKLELAKEITPDMEVYKALNDCVFGENESS